MQNSRGESDKLIAQAYIDAMLGALKGKKADVEALKKQRLTAAQVLISALMSFFITMWILGKLGAIH